MAPTINPTVHETGAKDWIIVRPYLRKGSKKGSGEEDEWGIKRGDVVTFWKPHRPEQMGIKRVVAVEGDVVYPKTGVYASLLEGGVGAKLEGMPDGLPDEDVDSIAARVKGKVVVPYGHVWVEGDNSRNSRDSREIGPISKGLVEGKAVWIWRGWGEFLRTGDRRSKVERELGSKVVEGKAEVPAVFLE
jgi:inner membrane protease subunit 2